MKRRPELLSPAGDFERFEAALRFGADAVYLAGSSFGMRAGPQNFPEEDLIKAVKEAHEKGVKVYLTLNTLPRNSEIPLLPDFIEMTASAGVDAYIAADIGTMAYCKKYAPSVPLHVSTQAGIVNYLTANEFYNMGAERIVTARGTLAGDYPGDPAAHPCGPGDRVLCTRQYVYVVFGQMPFVKLSYRP